MHFLILSSTEFVVLYLTVAHMNLNTPCTLVNLRKGNIFLVQAL